MSIIHTFVTANQKGKYGEYYIANYLVKKGYTIEFKNTKYYDLVVRKDTEEYKLEIKTEYYKSNNIFFETIVDGKLGWTQKYPSSTSIHIVWLFPNNNHRIVTLPAKELSSIDYRQYVKKDIVNRWGGRIIDAVGYLVPIEDIEATPSPAKLTHVF